MNDGRRMNHDFKVRQRPGLPSLKYRHGVVTAILRGRLAAGTAHATLGFLPRALLLKIPPVSFKTEHERNRSIAAAHRAK